MHEFVRSTKRSKWSAENEKKKQLHYKIKLTCFFVDSGAGSSISS